MNPVPPLSGRAASFSGDACLVAVAQVLANVTKRAMDFVGRYGGEEFVCVLPETICPTPPMKRWWRCANVSRGNWKGRRC
ncbi:MAG: diguanylate cyclase [Magnetococcales bacterium]|nr:diguanylate cyclase [Magnetococcales bacterium]